MRLNTTINRYLLKEMLTPSALNMIFFTFVFLMTQILEITNLIVNYRISVFILFKMLVYSMPYFLVFVMPMSVMMGVLLTFLRLSNDREILALKAGGVSILQLVPPVFVFCLAGSLLTAFMGIYALPWGQLSLKRLTYQVAAQHFDVGLKPGTFNDSFSGITMYVSAFDRQSKLLKDVFIEDHRNETSAQTLVAPRGRLLRDPRRLRVQLRLYDGIIYQVDIDSRSVNTVHFERYDVNLDIQRAASQASAKEEKDDIEMSLPELRDFLAHSPHDSRYYLALMQYYKKFSMPFACFALGLLAIPLGVQTRFAKRSFGLALGLLAFLFYYLLLSAGQVFGEAGKYPPIIGMWVPNLVVGAIGLWLFVRTLNERPVSFDFLYRVTRRLRRRRGC